MVNFRILASWAGAALMGGFADSGTLLELGGDLARVQPNWARQLRGNEMLDTYTLSFQNFRSIEDATVEAAPLTVVYGPNGSGKSSLIYGLLTLRNFLTNPDLDIPSLFSYPSISLGGHQEVVHRHSPERGIALSIGTSNPEHLSSKFTLTLYESGGSVDLSFAVPSVQNDRGIATWPQSLPLKITVPYQMDKRAEDGFAMHGSLSSQAREQGLTLMPIPGRIAWDGIALAAWLDPSDASYSDVIGQLNERANLPMELARQTGFVPLRRGFSEPTHSQGKLSPALSNENEVAMLLAEHSERFRQYEISRFVEKIADRRIQTQSQIRRPTFSIDSIPTGTGVPASIVNEGFGINQLVYMLTICLYSRYKIVAIEEPEIHLHPSMVRKLAIALAEIAKEKDRRLIVSTHSETFVVALLSQIAAGKIDVEDVSFVLAENPNGSTILTQQQANRNGQIEGGLRAFMASEAKDLIDFLGLSEE